MEQYAIYLRKSRADIDSTIEETLRRHKETLLAFAMKNELNITDIFEEVVSGESLYSRPQMLKLLENVGNRCYTGVLCMDIDRLGRGGMSDQGIILETFKQSDTMILTPNKAYNLNDENDENNIEFKAFFARFEYKQITKRLKAGTKKSVQEGCFLAPAPFGYRNTSINKKATLEIYEPEANIVRMIFDMYANQNMGCQVIANTVNSMGIKPHRAGEFGRTSIMGILKNPAYIGKIVWDKQTHLKKGSKGNQKHRKIQNPKSKWTVADAIHQPIIDTELWEKTQNIIQNRYHPPSFTGKIKNPLSGLIFCGNCGHIMYRSSPNRNKPSDKPRFTCPKKSCIPATRVEYVENELINVLEEKVKELELNIQKSKSKPDTLSYSDEIKALQDSLNELKKQKNKLHDLLERGVYDVDTFIERQGVLKKREAEIIGKIEYFQNLQDKSRTPNYAVLKNKIQNVLNAYQSSDTPTRNQLLKTVIEKITYRKEKGWKSSQFDLDITFRDFYI